MFFFFRPCRHSVSAVNERQHTGGCKGAGSGVVEVAEGRVVWKMLRLNYVWWKWNRNTRVAAKKGLEVCVCVCVCVYVGWIIAQHTHTHRLRFTIQYICTTWSPQTHTHKHTHTLYGNTPLGSSPLTCSLQLPSALAFISLLTCYLLIASSPSPPTPPGLRCIVGSGRSEISERVLLGWTSASNLLLIIYFFAIPPSPLARKVGSKSSKVEAVGEITADSLYYFSLKCQFLVQFVGMRSLFYGATAQGDIIGLFSRYSIVLATSEARYNYRTWMREVTHIGWTNLSSHKSEFFYFECLSFRLFKYEEQNCLYLPNRG